MDHLQVQSVRCSAKCANRWPLMAADETTRFYFTLVALTFLVPEKSLTLKVSFFSFLSIHSFIPKYFLVLFLPLIHSSLSSASLLQYIQQ